MIPSRTGLSPMPSEDSVLAWLKQEAIPLQTLDPAAPLDDLFPLKEVIKNASIVGLGEACHRVHEFFVMKHRLLRFLVEHMGFTMFAMEIDWPSAQLINQYVVQGIGDARSVLDNSAYGIWKTEEVLNLLLWMHDYNADPHHTHKVRFVGFDCVATQGASLDRIIQFFQVVDPERSGHVANLYRHVPRTPSSATWRALDQDSRRELSEAAAQVYQMLQEQRQAYIAKSTQEEFEEIVQEARIVHQVLLVKTMARGSGPADPLLVQQFQQREYFMAENIMWLHQHMHEGQKMVLWAHSWHLGTLGKWCCDPYGRDIPFTYLGNMLRERYQQDYLPIGFSFCNGTIGAFLVDEDGNDLSSQAETFTIQPPIAGCAEEMLAKAGSAYLLDLRASRVSPLSVWLAFPRPIRIFDTTYCKNERQYYHTASLPAWYDAIIHVQDITRSRPLSP